MPRVDGPHCVVSFPGLTGSTSSCILGTRRTFVATNGDLWPCERTRHTPYLKIGNVQDGLNLPYIRQVLAEYADLTQEECQDCWCLHGCQVGCPTTLCMGKKPTRAEKPAACERYRAQCHKNLVAYRRLPEQNPHALDYMEHIKIG